MTANLQKNFGQHAMTDTTFFMITEKKLYKNEKQICNSLFFIL